MARWWRRGDSDPALPQAQSAIGSTPAATPPPVQRAAWRDLPPLRPTLTTTPPVAPRDSFTASLATSHNPSFLAPLGHIVDPDGPSGHVEGLASPVAPQVISGGPDLPVAQRQASSAATVVQRVLTPRMWLSDSAGSEGSQTPASKQSEPTFSVPDEQPPAATADRPRHLESVSSAASQPSYVTAPDQDVVRALPVVAAPSQGSTPSSPSSTASAAPMVSRHVADESADDHGETDQQSTFDSVGADSTSPESAGPIAPLLGNADHAPSDQPVAGPEHRSDSDAPTPGSLGGPGPASAVQRSTAVDAPVRRPGLGAPLPTVPTFGSVPSNPSMHAVQRIPDPSPGGLPGGSPSFATPPVQRSAAADSTDHPPDHPHGDEDGSASDAMAGQAPDAPVLGMSTVMRALDASALTGTAPSSVTAPSTGSEGHHVVASPSVQRPSRPLGLGAPLASAADSAAPVQRHFDSTKAGSGPSATTSTGSPTDAGESGSAPTVMHSPTLGLADPFSSPSAQQLGHAETTGTAAPGELAAASGADRAEDLVLPAPVQRAIDDPPGPATGSQTTTGSTGADEGTSQDIAFSGEVAPLLGGPADPSGNTPSSTGPVPQHLSTESSGAVSNTTLTGPLVQRAASSTGTAAPANRSQVTSTGLGAPLPSVPSTAVASDRFITAREMSLQRMFEPGAAAIASGAAYSDGGNSVVFRPPTTSPPIIESPTSTQSTTVGEEPASSSPRSDLPMRTLPVARSAIAPMPVVPAPITNPTLGSSFGGDQAVQRFGLPSASSLMSGARKAASGVADTARQTAGSYADTARDTAGGYLNQARGAADSAASGAAGYLNSARSAAGGYADSAAGAASGYLASARSAAGGVADRAGAAVDDVATAAQGAVGGAVDSVSNAASGAQAAAGDAVSGAAGAVAGAVGAVGGAAAGAAGALPTDLDELARRLFDPLSARFKSELWLDRERAGMVTDLRR